MSDIMDVNQINLSVGNFIGAGPWPLSHIPKLGGGITVVDVALNASAAGTAIGLILVSMTDVASGGTPAVNGTIATFGGTIIPAATVGPFLATIGTQYVATPCNLGVAQTSGTLPAGTEISVSYVMGK